MDEKNVNAQFVSLVMMLGSAAWQQLGKVPNPMSGKVEKELDHARVTIDILSMLHEKTKGNLSSEEERLISNLVSDLQMNYADEALKKADTDTPPSSNAVN